MSLPRGVTYQYVAKLFQAGHGIDWLSTEFQCTMYDIERAIRAVMRRKGKR